jgi:hypothetical protein
MHRTRLDHRPCLVGLLGQRVAAIISHSGNRGRDGEGAGVEGGKHRVQAGVAGWPVRRRAAATARCRTASGLRAGMPSPWRVKALRSDGQVVPQLGGGGVDAAQLFGQGEGSLGLGPVGEEAATR